MIHFVFKFLSLYCEATTTFLSDFNSVLRRVHVIRFFFFFDPTPLVRPPRLYDYIFIVCWSTFWPLLVKTMLQYIYLFAKIILKHREKRQPTILSGKQLLPCSSPVGTYFFNHADFTFYQSAVNFTDQTHVCRSDKAHHLNQS